MSEHTPYTPEQSDDREPIFPENWVEAYLRRLGIVATDSRDSQNGDE